METDQLHLRRFELSDAEELYKHHQFTQDLMVRPDYQNKGIGTELMNKAISHIKEKGIYMISVIYGEEGLKGFYERFGFYTMLCGQMETYKSK